MEDKAEGKITRLEYKVRTVERYIITRYAEYDDGRADSSARGEFENPDQAWETGYALCKVEHEKHTDIPHFDERVKYPEHPKSVASKEEDITSKRQEEDDIIQVISCQLDNLQAQINLLQDQFLTLRVKLTSNTV